MAPSSPTQRKLIFSNESNISNSENTYRATLAVVDTATWYCSIIIIALILFTTFRDTLPYEYDPYYEDVDSTRLPPLKGGNLVERQGPCDEIYVVGVGETLHTISDKCGDPFIVERNPHIHDPDDVFPGLVIKIVPSGTSNKRLR
ncbi:hypothetical protein vseg_014639 [Gypsophila vaccaria]